MELAIPQKINWNNWNWNAQVSKYSSKKQKNNEIRYQQTLCSRYAEARKRDRMHPNPALTGIKRHVRTPRSDAFPRTWRTHQRCGISVSRPHLEGNMWHDGQSGCRKWG